MSRKFTADTDTVNFGNVTTFNGLTALSVACWFFLDSTANTATGRRWVTKWGATFATSDCFILTQSDNAGTQIEWTTLTNSTNYFNVKVAGALSTGSWNHALATWAGGTTGNIYLNGIAQNPSNVGSGSPTGLQNVTTAFRIGQDGDAENSILGSLAEVAIWSKGLSATDALALFNGVVPRVIETASLLYYLPLTGTLSPEINQIDGVSGTITGTVSNVLPPAVVAERVLLLTG